MRQGAGGWGGVRVPVTDHTECGCTSLGTARCSHVVKNKPEGACSHEPTTPDNGRKMWHRDSDSGCHGDACIHASTCVNTCYSHMLHISHIYTLHNVCVHIHVNQHTYAGTTKHFRSLDIFSTEFCPLNRHPWRWHDLPKTQRPMGRPHLGLSAVAWGFLLPASSRAGGRRNSHCAEQGKDLEVRPCEENHSPGVSLHVTGQHG